MEHSAACQAITEAHKAVVAQFEAKYPRYCRTCGGQGEWIGYDYDSESFLESCASCFDNGVCPLCGVSGQFDEWPACTACGVDFMQPHDTCPPDLQGPCLCQEQFENSMTW